MEVLKVQPGLEAQHVLHKGTLAAMPDILTGKIQSMLCDATAALNQIKAGKVIALRTSTARQTAMMTDVPPISTRSRGAGRCRACRNATGHRRQADAELNKIIATDDFRQQLTNFGIEPDSMSPDDFSTLVKTHVTRRANPARQSGPTLD